MNPRVNCRIREKLGLDCKPDVFWERADPYPVDGSLGVESGTGSGGGIYSLLGIRSTEFDLLRVSLAEFDLLLGLRLGSEPSKIYF